MSVEVPLSVGIVGTSWWVDAMYLPAINNYPNAKVTAICGRNYERTEEFALRWGIEKFFTDYSEMIKSGLCDAVIVSTTNDSHAAITMEALELGLHVLCEKPLAMNYAQAKNMLVLADKKAVKHMVPFTYSFMPATRYLKTLVDENYLGAIYHFNMRFYAGYGRSGQYMWRFDKTVAGAGVLADLGSHFIHLASWYFGEIKGVYCQLGAYQQRAELNHCDQPYDKADDVALVTLTFANGMIGSIHLSTQAFEVTGKPCDDYAFGQVHEIDIHGSKGTIHYKNDWNKIEKIYGARPGDENLDEIAIPDSYWNGAPRGNVYETYKDIFHNQNHMARGWLEAILNDHFVSPSFNEGVEVQRVIDAALISDRTGRWVDISEVEGELKAP